MDKRIYKYVLIPNFMNGKYKSYTIERLCKKFKILLATVNQELHYVKGITLEDILLYRHRKGKYTADEVKELESLGVVFIQDKDIKRVYEKQLEVFRDGKYIGYSMCLLSDTLKPKVPAIYIRVKLYQGQSLEQIFKNCK